MLFSRCHIAVAVCMSWDPENTDKTHSRDFRLTALLSRDFHLYLIGYVNCLPRAVKCLVVLLCVSDPPTHLYPPQPTPPVISAETLFFHVCLPHPPLSFPCLADTNSPRGPCATPSAAPTATSRWMTPRTSNATTGSARGTSAVWPCAPATPARTATPPSSARRTSGARTTSARRSSAARDVSRVCACASDFIVF